MTATEPKALTLTLADGLAIEYAYGPEVEPWLQAGSDAHVVAAARVSTSKDTKALLSKTKGAEWLSQRDEALIDTLVTERHAGPFYHGTLSVYIDCPLFVWAQIATHPELRRSRESARYRTLRPKFYVPSIERTMMANYEGFSPMRPVYHSALEGQYAELTEKLIYSYADAWRTYIDLKGQGVAKEVCRAVLPQAIMSTGIVSARPLDWLRALSVRTQTPDSAHISHVQAETADVFMRIDAIMGEYWPKTMQAFDKAGRVAP